VTQRLGEVTQRLGEVERVDLHVQLHVQLLYLLARVRYPGVEYWLSDWQSEEMTQRKYRINADERFYKQE
jgi:hypothetical protein